MESLVKLTEKLSG